MGHVNSSRLSRPAGGQSGCAGACISLLLAVCIVFLGLGASPGWAQLVPTDADVAGVAAGEVLWGDVDGDGDQDLLVVGNGSGTTESADPTARLYKNQGDGTFTEMETDLTGVSAGAAAFADFDDDGDLDLIITGNQGGFSGDNLPQNSATLYENDGTGSFTPVNAGIEGVTVGSVDWGDVDGDGDLDLVVTGNVGGFGELNPLCPPICNDPEPSIRIYENEGDGTFSQMDAGISEGVALGASSFGDYDGDGDLDLVVSGGQGSIEDPVPFSALYVNDGTGSFTRANAGLTDLAGGATTWADVDGDGDLDLLLAGQDAQEVPQTELYLTDGESLSPEPNDLVDVAGGQIAASDVDEDGDVDLLVTGRDTSETPQTILYRNDGTGSFSTVEADLAAVEGSAADWGHLGPEADPDLAVVGRDADSVATAAVYENQTDEPTCPASWTLRVTITDADGRSGVLTLGQGPTATAGLDPSCNEVERSPTPPAAPFDLRFGDTDLPGVDLGNGTLLDLRPDDEATGEPLALENAPAVWRLEVESEDAPWTVAWTPEVFSDSLGGTPAWLVDADTGGDELKVDMTATDTATVSGDVGPLEIRLDPPRTREIPLADGWNLSSIPVDASAPFGELLPSCTSGFFYAPDQGYQVIESDADVPPGQGVFANCTEGTASVEGRTPDSTRTDVQDGWNLVGPFTAPVASDAVESSPPGIVQTPFYEFGAGYSTADTLQPGQGYWVKVAQNGTLDLSGEADASVPWAAAPEPTAGADPGAALVLRDARGHTATLRLARSLSKAERERYALPPKAPGDQFDVRFASSRAVSVLSSDGKEEEPRTVALQGVAFPVELQLKDTPDGPSTIRVEGAGDEAVDLTSGDPRATLDAPTSELHLGAGARPSDFALRRSRPNPVREEATIEYAVPKETRVTIALYDLLGRRVQTLMEDEQTPPGHHTVSVDAGSLPSGTYFYRMQAGSHESARRLVVVQ